MSKSKLQNYNVNLFIVVENSEGLCSSGVVSFDAYSENEFNAVLDVMKYINLDVIKLERAKQVCYRDDFTWYDAIDYSIIRVVDINKISC